jgi:F1F0 ATPase subunit 2
MNEALVLVPAGIAGGVLGAVFFGGLWWTVRKGIASKQPALWFLGSVLLRTSITLAGFYAVSGSHWDRMTACLAGFLLARVAVTRMTAASAGDASRRHTEANHAP